MSCITKQTIHGQTYLSLSQSYWDKTNKRPANSKQRIGKIDPLTGEAIYKPWYISQLAKSGEDTSGMQVWNDARKGSKATTITDTVRKVLESVQSYGLTHFLKCVAQSTGLLPTLQSAIPKYWAELFYTACYIVSSPEALMHIKDWAESNDIPEKCDLVSQRISDLFDTIKYEDRARFYRSWYTHIRENEYIALDITSVSSYSQNLEDVEWGYNRDKDALPQINILMMFGETSRLPVWHNSYQGSLHDVSTLESALSEFAQIAGRPDILLVMDKGFYSNQNLLFMMNGIGTMTMRFLCGVSFTVKRAREMVKQEAASIDVLENVVVTSGDPIRGVTREWLVKSTKTKKGGTLYAHIFFDPNKAVNERNHLFSTVYSLLDAVRVTPKKKELQKSFAHYLNLDGEPSIKENVVQKELETAGWFVLLSNQISDKKEALDIYRAKDVVEQSFKQYKLTLGMERLRIHTNDRIENKMFVTFLALTLVSHIHKIMHEKNMHRNWTLTGLLTCMSKIRGATVDGLTVLRPLTKDQKSILDAFGFKPPTP